jgi:hypothetical protein
LHEKKKPKKINFLPFFRSDVLMFVLKYVWQKFIEKRLKTGLAERIQSFSSKPNALVVIEKNEFSL